EAQRPCGLGIDDQLELGRLHNRQICWLGALEDSTGVDAELTKRVRQARTVTHQAAGFRILAHGIDGGYRMARCQRGQLEPPAEEERVGGDQERVDSVADKRCEGGLDLAAVARPNNVDLLSEHGSR